MWAKGASGLREAESSLQPVTLRRVADSAARGRDSAKRKSS